MSEQRNNNTTPPPQQQQHQQHGAATPSPAPSRYTDNDGGEQHVSVGQREQLVALRKNLPTHSELLRVCEQFPEDGERLSAYVAEVEKRICDMEKTRRENQRAQDRHRHEVARRHADEVTRQKAEKTYQSLRQKQESATRNNREAARERERQRNEKLMLEATSQEQMRRFHKQRQTDNEERAQLSTDHWLDSVQQATDNRQKLRALAHLRREQEQSEWQHRVEISRIRKEELQRERATDISERNQRLSNMAQHKHDLAIQARMRRESGKEEKIHMVRAGVRRAEAANVANIIAKIEENELRHVQIVGEQKQRRQQRVAALRRDREMHRQLAQTRQGKIAEEQEEKRDMYEEKNQRDFARHLQHHSDIRAETERRIHETNDRRNRAHHVVVENRKSELEDAARKIVARSAKIGTTVGVNLQATGNNNSVLDEEMQHASENPSTSFRLNYDQNQSSGSRQRRYFDTSSSSMRDYQGEDEEEEPDPRNMPSILRTQHLSPKKAANGNSLEFILEIKPPKERGVNLKLLAESAKKKESKKKEEEEKLKKEKEEKEKKEKEEKEKKEKEKKEKEKKEKEEKEKKDKEEKEKKEKAEKEEKEKKEKAEKEEKEKAEAEAELKKKKKEEEEKEQEKQQDSRHTLPESAGQKTETSSSSYLSVALVKATKPASRGYRVLIIAASYKELHQQKQQQQEKEKEKEETNSTTTTNKIPKELPTASNDAATAMAMFQNIVGSDFTQRMVLVDDSNFIGKTATPEKDAILEALDWITTDCQPQDNLIIYYSGDDGSTILADNSAFGLDAASNDAPAFIPVDCESNGIISQKTFLEKLHRVPVGCRVTLLSNTPLGNSLADYHHQRPVRFWSWNEDDVSYSLDSRMAVKAAVDSSVSLQCEVFSFSGSTCNSNNSNESSNNNANGGDNQQQQQQNGFVATNALASVLSSYTDYTSMNFILFLTRWRDAVLKEAYPTKNFTSFTLASNFEPEKDSKFSFMCLKKVEKNTSSASASNETNSNKNNNNENVNVNTESSASVTEQNKTSNNNTNINDQEEL